MSGASVSLLGDAAPWRAVQVRSSLETRAFEALSQKGLEVFLPTCPRRRRLSDRWKMVQSPLFPGYLFCRLNPEARLRVLATPGFISVVSFGTEFAVVDETEINSIRAVCDSNLPFGPYPFLREGRKVRVTGGPLKGAEGTILRLKSKVLLVVGITLLQRAVAVELDREFVAPVH